MKPILILLAISIVILVSGCAVSPEAIDAYRVHCETTNGGITDTGKAACRQLRGE